MNPGLTPVLLETMKAIEGATEHIDALAQFAQDLSEWLQSFLSRIEQTRKRVSEAH